MPTAPFEPLTAPFEPVTKKRAAAILQVSIRTLDYWLEHSVEHGEMPKPKRVGRHCYWHPDEFFGWLSKRLKPVPDKTGTPIDNKTPATLTQTPSPEAEQAPSRPTKQARSSARRSTKPSGKTSTKQKRMSLDDLNAP
jgi:phage terminase Nu1 subunit (DNA packaging protein)